MKIQNKLKLFVVSFLISIFCSSFSYSEEEEDLNAMYPMSDGIVRFLMVNEYISESGKECACYQSVKRDGTECGGGRLSSDLACYKSGRSDKDVSKFREELLDYIVSVSSKMESLSRNRSKRIERSSRKKRGEQMSSDPERIIEEPTIEEQTVASSIIISEKNSYRAGSCPCPYSVKEDGDKCGEESKWSESKGQTPACYITDVTKERYVTYKGWDN